MLATRLGETNASLERASEAKSRFLANVSHELRTPMTAILGFTDALLAGVDGPLNTEQEASLGWVQRGGQDLLGLINEILDLSKIESGKLTIDAQPFDPRELVEAVVAQHRSLAAQKGIRLGWSDTGAPTEVVLDRQRVRQILVNLVGNALKFTEAGQVDVETGRAAGGGLLVTVRDTGPGIAAEQQELDLRGVPPGGGRRTRLRPRSGHQPAPGASDGWRRRISRASPDRGSTFSLVLPLDCRPLSAAPAGFEPIAARDGERVLLCVDDDPSVAPLLQKMLVGHGYRVVASRVVAAAVADARRVQPAAILIDLRLREGDGSRPAPGARSPIRRPGTSR